MEFGQGALENMVTHKINKTFWGKKRVMITGHTGFKGSWLSLWLQTMGACVTGYSLSPPTRPSLFEAARVAEGMKSVTGDVRDFDHVTAVISEHKPEIIIHMAAQSLVRYSYKNPLETYTTNVIGTVNVLEAVRVTPGVKVVIIVTSDKCYENKEWLWGYRENDRIGGYDPYSSSKGCAELVTAAYRSSYFPEKKYGVHGVAVASVRAGNVIGGGDWSDDRLVPDIVKAFKENRPVIIRNPQSIRPWQYVLEPLHGYLCLSERLWERGQDFSEGWNFGPNDEGMKTVSWIADRLAKLWGGNARWEMDSGLLHPHEANLLKLDCSKARNILCWKPKLSLSSALEWIVEWYRNYYAGKDMRKHSHTEISHFEEYEHEEVNTINR
jgi:CDP-glucose 4,6-dehydratase